MTLSRNIKAEMARNNINQKELAIKLNLSKTSIYNKLTGKRNWTIDEITQLSTIFGVSIEYFFKEFVN